MRRLALTGLLVLLYAVTGWLSLRLSLVDNFVSVMYLPAGVALSAFLIWQHRAWPGVLLGGLLVQWMANSQAGWTVWKWPTLLSVVCAGLQALLASLAIRRWVGYPGDIDVPRRAWLMFAAIIPTGQLLNATVSVLMLAGSGAFGVAGSPLTAWWFWWQGDVLGALLMTPLMLVAFGQPADTWRPRWKTVAIPMAVALLFVFVGFAQLQASEERAQEQRFHQDAEALTERLQRRLDAQTDAVMAVARARELMKAEDRIEFRLITQHWLERYPGTQNFGWSPLVAHADRAAFEARAGNLQPGTGSASYAIKGRDSTGKIFSAEPSASYLPILFVEPLQRNQSVLGLDIQVLPVTARAVRATMTTGLPHVTEGFRLVQETGEQRGVVMYQAVMDDRRKGPLPDTVRGVISAVFRMDDVIASALGPLDETRLTACLIDPGARNDNQRLFGSVGCGGDQAPQVRHFSSSTVKFGERTWLFQVASGPAFDGDTRGWGIWATLSVSLVAVVMLGVFLILQAGHSRRTEQLVIERTRELAQSNAGLQQLALYDPLTGLANRTHWVTEARRALEAARRYNDMLAVAFVDLDHFKLVNDSLGHSVGDALLKSVASRLQACLRQYDVMARQGGDEFVVLLNRLQSRNDAAAIAAKMVELLAQPFALHGHEVTVSASVGLVWAEGGEDDVETLLRHADLAMYRAKAAGRNAWCFYEPSMDQSVTQRLLVESGLRRALVNNELVLHYQPQVDCKTGAITGVEALVRWQHPELGLLMPDRFVPQAESSGQIDELGNWVMRKAFSQAKAWADQGLDGFTVAINVSAVEFGRPTFIERFSKALADSGVSPQRVELEITETALMQSLPELVERLGEISRSGVRLALDDFGTGYSSLGYLKRLPLHCVKIDRSFVRDIPGDKEDEAIICATLSMARALGLSVVAEGVELPAQRRFLGEQGCQYIQGWLVARPMAADAFEAWWRRHQVSHA